MKRLRMRKAAKSIYQEYDRALQSTPSNMVDHDNAAVDKQVLEGVMRWGHGFQYPMALRDYLGLCPLGRGHWHDHCEEVNCAYELERTLDRLDTTVPRFNPGNQFDTGRVA